MDSKYNTKLEKYRGLKDVKYIVYKYVHQLKFRKCFDEMYKCMEWDDKRSCWITRYEYLCERDVSVMMHTYVLYNYRKQGFSFCAPIYKHVMSNGSVTSYIPVDPRYRKVLFNTG